MALKAWIVPSNQISIRAKKACWGQGKGVTIESVAPLFPGGQMLRRRKFRSESYGNATIGGNSKLGAEEGSSEYDVFGVKHHFWGYR